MIKDFQDHNIFLFVISFLKGKSYRIKEPASPILLGKCYHQVIYKRDKSSHISTTELFMDQRIISKVEKSLRM
jgi:hypothetical protein